MDPIASSGDIPIQRNRDVEGSASRPGRSHGGRHPSRDHPLPDPLNASKQRLRQCLEGRWMMAMLKGVLPSVTIRHLSSAGWTHPTQRTSSGMFRSASQMQEGLTKMGSIWGDIRLRVSSSSQPIDWTRQLLCGVTEFLGTPSQLVNWTSRPALIATQVINPSSPLSPFSFNHSLLAVHTG